MVIDDRYLPSAKLSTGGYLNKIAVSDPRRLEGLTQFQLLPRRACPQRIGTIGNAESDMREGGFCAILFQTVRNSLILKRRDVRVVEGARLESVCRGNSTVGSNPTLSAIRNFALSFQ